MNRIAFSFMLLFLTLYMAGCSAPGEGSKAEAWYRKAEPVIVALKKYHEKQNQYPTTLQELVPEYLSENTWRQSDGTLLGDAFEYKKMGRSYELKFSYTGPGINHCFYQPEVSKWECFGYY